MTRITHLDRWRRAVLRAAGVPEPADAELLSRFITTRDEAAFASLVARHGRLVYGVCRRVLADRHRAEDAYQAVWLVLARQAATVRPAARLPAWLHGVAVRTALRARRTDARRRRYEQNAPPPVEPRPTDPELGAVLDAELAALPERLRLPVLLCDLGGQPQREAARSLCLPTTTLVNRLKAARDRLAVRLAARGLAPAVTVAALEPLPTAAAGEPAVRLAEDVLMGLTLAKWKAAVVVLVVAVGVAVAGRAVGDGPLFTPPADETRREQAANAPASPDPRSFLERVVGDLRGDTPTPVERNYYAADPDAFRDHKVARWLADDPAVRTHVGRRFGWLVRLAPTPDPETTTGPVRLQVWTDTEGGRRAAERVHLFEWPITEPRQAVASSWTVKESQPATGASSRLPAYRVEPPDILQIEAVRLRKDPATGETLTIPLPVQPIAGQHLVRPDGTIGLGIWGSVAVGGKTLGEVEAAVRDHLAAALPADGTKLDRDRLRVVADVKAYNSKRYYVIVADEGSVGEQVYAFPVTGSDSVLDALANIGGLPAKAGKRSVWVARRAANGGPDQILPVDWVGITQHGATATNYQLQPGDRIHVQLPDPAAQKRVDEAEARLNELRQKLKPGVTTPEATRLETAVREARLAAMVRDAAVRPPVDSDEVFLRRLLLDTRGTPPTGLEVKYFTADPDPDKRAKLARWLNVKPPARPTARDRYTLLPPDSISVAVTRADGKPDPTPGLTYSGHLTLNPDGSLPEVFGFNSVNVAGLTAGQAAEAIRRAAKNPADADRIRVEVKVIGYNNHRGFELILDGEVRKVAYQGETVFRHLMRAAEGPADYDGKRVWIDRGGKVLPVDWDAITRRRDEATNHVIEPGDKLYVTGRPGS